jgi:predicted DNA-binding protein
MSSDKLGDKKDKATSWREALEQIVEKTQDYSYGYSCIDSIKSREERLLCDLRKIAIQGLGRKPEW